MLSFILIATIASLLMFFFIKKTSKPEPVTPEITEQEIHADLHSHVEPTPPIVVIEPPVASVVEETTVADEKPAVIAAAKKKPAKKAKKKVDA